MEVCEFARLLKHNNRDSEVWLDLARTCYLFLKQERELSADDSVSYHDTLMSKDAIYALHSVTGATTNPRLITRAVLENAEYLPDFIDTLAPGLCTAEKARQVYDWTVLQGAQPLLSLWDRSEGRHGWFSAQVDCGENPSVYELVERGKQLAALAPNIMIKIPGSANGYQAIEQLVALGYSVNNTFCFTVSQCDAALEAIQNGRARAYGNGVDTDRAHYVISYMIGRLGDEQAFLNQATRLHLSLGMEERRWAELAVFNKMQAMVLSAALPVRLLLCSLKVDIDAQGLEECWHLERTGFDTTLYTLTPEIIEFIQRRHLQGRPVKPALSVIRVPDSVMDKLLRLDYFSRAYLLYNPAPASFEHYPAFVTARGAALIAQHQLQRFIEASAGHSALWATRDCSVMPRTVR